MAVSQYLRFELLQNLQQLLPAEVRLIQICFSSAGSGKVTGEKIKKEHRRHGKKKNEGHGMSLMRQRCQKRGALRDIPIKG